VVPIEYQSDVESIFARRFQNGGDYWATADGLVGVGSPFSTVQCVLMLIDLGLEPTNHFIKGASKIIMEGWREDGRFRNLSKGSIYPCHTAMAARVLCRADYSKYKKLQVTFEHLLNIIHFDGGWRCSKFTYGRGPETEYSNPGTTLDVLDAFRFTDHLNREKRLDKVVDFLLEHWITRKPLGPCHFGIGSRFMQVEYPLFRYNIFNYVYVLSFYKLARKDPRFIQALTIFESKLVGGNVVIERPHRELANLNFCERGVPSDAATKHYQKILRNIAKD
jgi:hypothetical protein